MPEQIGGIDRDEAGSETIMIQTTPSRISCVIKIAGATIRIHLLVTLV
jgi:hypothetical protein